MPVYSVSWQWKCAVAIGMAPDYLPRISARDCGYPFTYLGSRYYGCVENLDNVTSTCERWGCYQTNYTGAVCAADVGTVTLKLIQQSVRTCLWKHYTIIMLLSYCRLSVRMQMLSGCARKLDGVACVGCGGRTCCGTVVDEAASAWGQDRGHASHTRPRPAVMMLRPSQKCSTESIY